MFITKHAVARYVERIAPELSLWEAKGRLLQIKERAEPTGRRTFKGEAIWRLRDPDALLVTKHDRRYGAICVTVLSPYELDVDDEALREIAEEIVGAAARLEGQHGRGETEGRTAWHDDRGTGR